MSVSSSSNVDGEQHQFSLTSTARKTVRSPFELAVIPAIQISTETQASCHFVSNFVLIPRQGTTRGFMDYLIPLMKTETLSSAPHLQFAFNACALASLGNRVKSDGIDFAASAHGEYAKALRATQAALMDPVKYTSDSVLATVLLLGMFENITAKKLGEFAWGSHIEGAIQLVKARGKKQLKTQTGLQLFIAVRTQQIIHALTSGSPPIMGVDWWLDNAVNDSYAAHCQRLNLQTSELRAEVTHIMTHGTTTAASPSSPSSPHSSPSISYEERTAKILSLMRRSQELDRAIVDWMASLPSHWRYRTLCWQDYVANTDYAHAEVFPGRVDVYSDVWIASMWNMGRVTRLILASITVRCAAWACSPVDYRTTPEYAHSARVCAEVISDVLASVPYHLGWHYRTRSKRRGGRQGQGQGRGNRRRNWDHTDDEDEDGEEDDHNHDDNNGEDGLDEEQLSGFGCGEDEQGAKGLAGYFLTWPLACVMGQDYLTEDQRTWLQVRIPSMLIRRDGLMAQPYPNAQDFERLLSSARKSPPVMSGYSLNPIQERERMQMEFMELKKKELLAKATGAAGKEGRYDETGTNRSDRIGNSGANSEERREDQEKVMVVARKWLTV
ncbi:unnamed protein product [Sordaria macrospora k-hell]|uniref:WGS project CABT00000000 data, contig 2.9 n=1 Tax=Sordaria macrospora (strain ATCC MYA-333 / DSM 997 / K(L3346) / K-hell) TaxID=771870 RepID=F7VVC7_SORMK|nr:uncharacterized protein SMAC_03498 [Sordaria macrospora k-hell]CCC09468.1 unnamed protein product [Sordaria macrospora k-hell]